MVAPISPVNGSELMVVNQDGRTVYVTRAQAAQILTLAGIRSRPATSVLTERTGLELFRAIQGGNAVEMSLANFTAYLAGTVPSEPIPFDMRASSFSGTERFVVRQGSGVAAADILQTMYLRGSGGSLYGLGGDGASNSAGPPIGFALNGSANTALKAAVARVANGTGRGKIVYMGDSTSVGVGAGTGPNFVVGARPFRVPAALAAALTTAGIPTLDKGITGDCGMWQTGSASASTGFSTIDPRFSAVTNVSASGDLTFAGGSYLSPPANAAWSLSWTEQGVDTFEETFYRSNTGAVNLTIDGAAPATGPSSFTTDAGGNFVRAVVKAATVGTHTLAIGSNITTTPALRSLRAYNSAVSAMDIVVLAAAGATVAQQASMGGSNWLARDALLFEAPDLTIIAPYFNDPNNDVPLATTLNGLQALITSAKVSGDVLLVSQYPAGGKYGQNQAAANTAIKNLAATNNVACISRYDNLGGTFAASNFADGLVHGTASFYASMGDLDRRCLQVMLQ
jgi:hypothetical protein